MSNVSPVAVVTGAARGIGRAISQALVAQSWRVAGIDVQEPAGADQVSGARYWRADISDIASHAALLDEVAAALGQPTCLVNNAGVTSLRRGDMLELTPESFDRVMAVNLRGGFFLSQQFARRLIAADVSPALPRSIIWISSINAEIVGDNRADYCLSKAATTMMTKLFASRLASHNISAFEVRPGIIATDMTAPAKERYDRYIAEGGVPLGRWGEPGDVAQVVATLARGDLPYCTGIHVDVAGGMNLHRL